MAMPPNRYGKRPPMKRPTITHGSVKLKAEPASDDYGLIAGRLRQEVLKLAC